MRYRKSLRLKNYDYSANGAYFITICTNFKRELIGRNEYSVIEKELKVLKNRFEGVTLDYYAIMDNHIHLILLFNETTTNLPRIMQAFKSITTLQLRKNGYQGKRFWQRNYYEHVIRNEKALYKIREYIQNNPQVEKLNYKDIYDNG